MKTFNVAYEIEQVVYLKTDPEQKPRIVIGILIRPGGVAYYLACGEYESLHYAIEITPKRDELLSLGVEVNRDLKSN